MGCRFEVGGLKQPRHKLIRFVMATAGNNFEKEPKLNNKYMIL